jgi:prolyl-tRNA editing enzyme YbaK/EbsC (Cys-tRNA(Pro) deacylase)
LSRARARARSPTAANDSARAIALETAGARHSVDATLIDEDLLQFARVHAAGGTPNAMFPIRPQDLVSVSNGRVANVKLDSY